MRQISDEQKNEIINKWIGTPYQYMRMEPGVGVDCIHLVKGILRDIDIPIGVPNYPSGWRESDPALFERSLYAVRNRWSAIHPNSIKFGDVVLIKDSDNFVKHAGIITDSAHFIHILNDRLGTARIDMLDNYRDTIKMVIRISA